MKYNVFINHAKEDRVTAIKLYRDLRNAGASPWMIENDLKPGKEPKQEIIRMIQECQYFITLISSKSLTEKGDVQRALKAALDKREEFPVGDISVIPVRLDDCEPEDLRLRSIHQVDLFPSYNPGFDKLLKVLPHRKKDIYNRITMEREIEDTDSSRNKEEKKSWLKFIFKLQESGNELYNSESPPEKTLMLTATKAYNLTLTAKPIKKPEDNYCLDVPESCNRIDILLYLENPIIGIGLSEQFKTIQLSDGAEKYEQSFEIQTEPNLAFGKSAFSVELQIKESKEEKKQIFTIPIETDSDYSPEDCVFLNNRKLNIDRKLSPNIAIIHVNTDAENENAVTLSLWALGQKKRGDISFRPPILCLAEFVSEKKKAGDRVAPPKTIIAKLKNFSNNYRGKGLKTWIEELEEYIGNELVLVIIDHTRFEIPWELWELNDDEYLGSRVTVVRGLPLPEWHHDKLKMENHSCEGKVFLHVDKDKLSCYKDEEERRKNKELINTELSIFKNYNKLSEIHRYKDIDSCIEGAISNLGLVYIGGEGYFSKENFIEIAIGSKNIKDNRLCVLDLVNYLSANFCNQPFFIINACHSARIAIENKENFFGFPYVTQKIASGFIGTLGPVSSEYAVDIIKQLFIEHYNEKNGITFARALRELRASVANELKVDRRNIQKQFKFLFTFMYVYYGNPLARLSLIPAEKVENSDGTC
jgi:hypothetical protein